jgi:insertion element IS1 protein InsB
MEKPLMEYEPGDVLELDELWSFVSKKTNKKWVWIALCRRTRQVVASYTGERSETSCRKLWEAVPDTYKQNTLYSDFWEAYSKALKGYKHYAVGKESGETNHVERWNNTLRQRIGRFVRKTLSFSKCEIMHWLYLQFFIYHYNQSLYN